MPILNLHFAVITNGTLISEAWVELFEKYKIMPAISIDGTEANHNKFRYYLNGEGSYKDVYNSIKLLQKSVEREAIPRIRTLTVMNSSHNAKEAYHHFVHNL